MMPCRTFRRDDGGCFDQVSWIQFNSLTPNHEIFWDNREASFCPVESTSPIWNLQKKSCPRFDTRAKPSFAWKMHCKLQTWQDRGRLCDASHIIERIRTHLISLVGLTPKHFPQNCLERMNEHRRRMSQMPQHNAQQNCADSNPHVPTNPCISSQESKTGKNKIFEFPRRSNLAASIPCFLLHLYILFHDAYHASQTFYHHLTAVPGLHHHDLFNTFHHWTPPCSSKSKYSSAKSGR